ncbi:hypothetical protein TVAG_193490 [Trichomonas vaginalis G3]|uniref:Uncharacterized protein n=1 Tax=Trichomonas vaginalis (strain ATCC PRA-98 / G3) TaxID=412133 RepID=A2DH63_TRIV3|nr:hypothetical protein TVAGG3_0340920 [Trichomonas vaginalis G3]EAY20373.1 hypothetical protein TVAG_193490 [Trichomonas vaginalis G3]KAI5530627.1 hypothetical protein TVAGG3_0340920 [Trichomonas vaginalis G3]|eukprot:XP_001581359.1 hypothetical protein [Trichomonas vaginalis G3]
MSDSTILTILKTLREKQLEIHYNNSFNIETYKSVTETSETLQDKYDEIKVLFEQYYDKIFAQYLTDVPNRYDFVKNFNYFLYETKVGNESHEEYMNKQRNNKLEDFRKLVKIELISPQFVAFFSEQINVIHKFYKSTICATDEEVYESFKKNFQQHAKQCPKFIKELFKIAGTEIVLRISDLMSDYPHYLGIIPYDTFGFIKRTELKKIISLFESDTEFWNEIIAGFQGSLSSDESGYIPKQTVAELNKKASEKATTVSKQSLRTILKVIPLFPEIEGSIEKKTFEEYLKSSISMIPLNLRRSTKVILKTQFDNLHKSITVSGNDQNPLQTPFEILRQKTITHLSNIVNKINTTKKDHFCDYYLIQERIKSLFEFKTCYEPIINNLIEFRKSQDSLSNFVPNEKKVIEENINNLRMFKQKHTIEDEKIMRNIRYPFHKFSKEDLQIMTPYQIQFTESTESLLICKNISYLIEVDFNPPTKLDMINNQLKKFMNLARSNGELNFIFAAFLAPRIFSPTIYSTILYFEKDIENNKVKYQYVDFIRKDYESHYFN